MNIDHAVVFHKIYGRGIISSFTDKLVFVVFDSLPEEIKKFQYPLCFESILSFENPELVSEVQGSIEKKQAENALLEKENQEEQRKGIAQSRTPRETSRRRSIQRPKKANIQDTRSNTAKGLATATEISIEDGYAFDRIVDVLNDVFHKGYESYMRGFCYVNEAKTVGAWFPKMAIIENGEEVAQSTTKAWINVLSDDGKEIRMYTKDPTLSSVVYHAEPHITFAKFPGEPYRYIGTFVRDLPRCTPTDVRFVRIATSFNIATPDLQGEEVHDKY